MLYRQPFKIKKPAHFVETKTVGYLVLSIYFSITILLINTPAYATYNQPSFDIVSDNRTTLDLIQARKQYQEALDALRAGQRKRFHQLQATLQDYPLFPYLIYYEYKRYISSANNDDIRDFINAHQDSPIGHRLRRTWLNYLAKTNQWQLYIDVYVPTASAQYNCHYYWAQYQIGEKETALKAAKDLWLVGNSQHKNCDQLFTEWKKTDAYNDQIIWQRIGLSINRGRTQLATFLSRSLSDIEDRKKVLDWKHIRSNPHKLENINYFKADSAKNREIILYGLYKLLKNDADSALAIWPQYQQRFAFTEDELQQFNLNIAKYLSYQYHSAADQWLQKVDLAFQDYDIHQKRIRLAMQQDSWPDVYHWITLLPHDKANTAQWQYWKAVALSKSAGELAVKTYFTKQPLPLSKNALAWQADPLLVHKNFVSLLNDSSSFSLDFHLSNSTLASTNSYLGKAKRIYEEISLDRNFYAFLASEKINKSLSLNAMTVSFNDIELAKIESKPGIQRARELYILGRPADARSEWYFAVQHFNSLEKSTAAKLAELWGWHNQAILTASSSSHRDNLDLRFPRAYHDTIAYNARQLGLNSAWVFSLIRQESAFMPDAKSSAGAMGMMQLMPSTAKQVTRNLGLRYHGERSLLDPKRNIRLGTAYLSELMKKFNGNIVLATAAYNAGPHRVKRWLPEESAVQGDVWVETIPISETRNYVQNILTYQAIYRYQLGRAPRMSNSLSFIYPKKTTDSTIAANNPNTPQ